MNAQEKILCERLRRSPYRSYLEGEIYETEEIVYFKLVGEEARLTALEARLRPVLAEHDLRAAVRPQTLGRGLTGFYIYSARATMAQAEETLMALLNRDDPSLKPMEIFARAPYRSEHDAMHLLHRLGNAYEPVKFLPRREEP